MHRREMMETSKACVCDCVADEVMYLVDLLLPRQGGESGHLDGRRTWAHRAALRGAAVTAGGGSGAVRVLERAQAMQ